MAAGVCSILRSTLRSCVCVSVTWAVTMSNFLTGVHPN